MKVALVLARVAASAVLVGTLAACAVSVGNTRNAGTASADQPVKAAYHMTLGIDESQRGLGNIRNHLAADPSAKIIVVGNGNGIEFMLDGAKDRNGNPFDATIQDLKSKGVEFRLCNNTLVTRKIDKSKVIPEVEIVQSGVAEAARLQAREGYVYLRP
ncbi:MAG: DsrE family protein [Burkholderiaceae bacterium]|nr:DsrE family protein [Burkholderiaceae bacterium]